MLRDPTIGVQGAEPQKRHRLKGPTTETTREAISKLSAAYLRQRNHAIKTKTQAAEIELAVRRGELVEKRLVEQQASYLLVNLRQKLLNLGSYAHRFTGTDQQLARQILREIGLSTLNEIRDLPNCVESNWLEKLEAEEASGQSKRRIE